MLTLKESLNHYTTSQLKREISKYNKTVKIAGYSKLDREGIIKLMLYNERHFTHLKLDKIPEPVKKGRKNKKEVELKKKIEETSKKLDELYNKKMEIMKLDFFKKDTENRNNYYSNTQALNDAKEKLKKTKKKDKKESYQKEINMYEGVVEKLKEEYEKFREKHKKEFDEFSRVRQEGDKYYDLLKNLEKEYSKFKEESKKKGGGRDPVPLALKEPEYDFKLEKGRVKAPNPLIEVMFPSIDKGLQKYTLKQLKDAIVEMNDMGLTEVEGFSQLSRPEIIELIVKNPDYFGIPHLKMIPTKRTYFNWEDEDVDKGLEEYNEFEDVKRNYLNKQLKKEKDKLIKEIKEKKMKMKTT